MRFDNKPKQLAFSFYWHQNPFHEFYTEKRWRITRHRWMELSQVQKLTHVRNVCNETVYRLPGGQFVMIHDDIAYFVEPRFAPV